MARLGADSVGYLYLSGKLLAYLECGLDSRASFWIEQVCELVGITKQDLKTV